MTSKENILDQLQKLAEDFINKHDELGMRATGEWAESIEILEDDFGGKILANDYTEQLVQGRRPGSMPPVSALETWVGAKFGLSGKEATSAAWAVATKIKNEGTTWYPEGSDLVDGVLDDERQAKILNAIGEAIVINQTEALIRAIKTAAA